MTRHRTAPPGLDFYETPAGTAWHGARLVYDCLLRPGAHVVDAGCGAGALTYAAAALGLTVTSIDIDPRMDSALKKDVLSDKLPAAIAAISNPPFGIWREFVTRLVETYPVVVALGPVTLLDTARTLPSNLARVVMTPRPRFIGHEHQAPMPHAWMVFSKGEPGPVHFQTCREDIRDHVRDLNRRQRQAGKVS